MSRKGRTCWHYAGVYSPVCTCSCTKCTLIMAHIKQDKWRHTVFIEVWCKVNGHIKKFKKGIVALLCVLERKKINPKKFVNRRKMKRRIFGNIHQFYDFSSWGCNTDAVFVLQNLPNSTNGQADFVHLPSIFFKLWQAVRGSERQKRNTEEYGLVCAAVGTFLPALFYCNHNLSQGYPFQPPWHKAVLYLSCCLFCWVFFM